MDATTCTPDWLSEAIRDDLVLPIDCRPQSEFVSSHITGSINIYLPQLLQRRLKKGNLTIAGAIACSQTKEKFLNRRATQDIVLYDGGTGDVNANTTGTVALLYETLKLGGCKARVLIGGFSRFVSLYPELGTSLPPGNPSDAVSPGFGLQSLSIGDSDIPKSAELSPCSSAVPVEVIPHLYLGNAKNSMDMLALERYNIRYILNVTSDLPNHFQHEDEIKYKQIPINDHWSQNLSLYFPEAISFIDEGRSRGLGVLVHCLAGVSRSVTVTVAYLMATKSLSLNDAYDCVKKVKPNISPNFNFMGQLLDFEQVLKKSAAVCTCSGSSDSNTEPPCDVCNKLFFTTPANALSADLDTRVMDVH